MNVEEIAVQFDNVEKGPKRPFKQRNYNGNTLYTLQNGIGVIVTDLGSNLKIGHTYKDGELGIEYRFKVIEIAEDHIIIYKEGK